MHDLSSDNDDSQDEEVDPAEKEQAKKSKHKFKMSKNFSSKVHYLININLPVH